MKVKRKIDLNGKVTTITASPVARLLDVVRGDLKLTGTKEGCGEGECGACSVLLNNEVIDSCLVLFGQLRDGDLLVTVEGLENKRGLNRLQRSFVKNGAVHCGACIPGMLIAATALLKHNKTPSIMEIKEGIAGNLCRCTGYGRIIKAIEEVV
ncbi:MAG: (2Fe-2S)-binding protein [Deltaproteobacteria bacterium]|nr:(2Fe-2S)-binding protein [Deltaproteobacteria bacterium]